MVGIRENLILATFTLSNEVKHNEGYIVEYTYQNITEMTDF